MKLHELKTRHDAFDETFAGRKRHEVRVNDRGFEVGDLLFLRRYNELIGQYEKGPISGYDMLMKVTYITEGGMWGLSENIVVMSVAPVQVLVVPPRAGFS